MPYGNWINELPTGFWRTCYRLASSSSSRGVSADMQRESTERDPAA